MPTTTNLAKLLLPVTLLLASASAPAEIEGQAYESGAKGIEGKRFEGGTREEFQASRDQFELWTGCKQIAIHLSARVDSEQIHKMYSQKGAFGWDGLKDHMDNAKDQALVNAIATAFESRLRGARLFSPYTGGANTAPIKIHIESFREEGHSALYGAYLSMDKELLDPLSGWHQHETTYESTRFYGYTSELGRWRSELESWAARAADRFIADYLRANADACNGAQSTPSRGQ